jgi:arylsulfatase A-like enzyme
VSYVDTQVGRVLDELDRQGLSENTIIILWGDRGWNLGEHTLWSKNCCFETSMNSPLIVSAPMLDGIQSGAKTTALTEFIDIYPSLCDLAGLPAPEHLEGTSFVPVLKKPSASYKDVAIGRFNDGDTIRADRYRYTFYTKGNGDVLGGMLYDHREDPDENVNIAGRAELAATVKQLEAQLLAGMGKPE